jgi:hypothetical protein
MASERSAEPGARRNAALRKRTVRIAFAIEESDAGVPRQVEERSPSLAVWRRRG